MIFSPINTHSIPQELKDRDQWVCWNAIPNKDKKASKPKKVPIDPKTGRPASVSDPSTWGTFKQALDRCETYKMPGIGYVFDSNDPFVGIDLDKCRNPETEDLEAWANDIISDIDSYTEVSPSGTGVHILAKGELERGARSGNIEMYNKGRFFTVTGVIVSGASKLLNQRKKPIQQLFKSITSQLGRVTPAAETTFTGMSPDKLLGNILLGETNNRFAELWAGSTRSYASPSEADLALCGILTKYTQDPEVIDALYRESNLYRSKWDEYRGEKTYGQKTIEKALTPQSSVQTEQENNEKQSHYSVAMKVIDVLGSENLIYVNNSFWQWVSTGIWNTVDDRLIKKAVHSADEQNKLTKSRIDSILELIKTEQHIQEHEFNRNTKTINCLNGELHFIENEWKLYPHDQMNYCTYQIPVAYDPMARPERFIRFLTEVFEGDEDCKEKSMLLQEFLGYALIPSCQFERFLLLIGQGANGKSVFLRVLEALVGPQNVCGVQPSQLEHKFKLAHLEGKLVNIVTEIPEGAVMSDALMKALVSGELLTAEKKNKPPFDFRPFCTMFFATNHMPYLRDFTNAFFRRSEIISFNRQFSERDRDTTLIDKLLEELPGILNLALTGLKRLYEQNGFTEVKSSLLGKEGWEQEANHVIRFVQESCEQSPGFEAEISTVYMRYSNWCQLEGIKPIQKQKLTNRLRSMGCHDKKGVGGSRRLTGIKLR